MKLSIIKKRLIYGLLYALTSAIFVSLTLLKQQPLNTLPLQILRMVIIAFASVLLLKYGVYMLLSPWYEFRENKRRASQPRLDRYEPLVSVLIPAWNEDVGLLNTVKTLLEGSYRHLEIIVINDGSTDQSDATMRRFLAKYQHSVFGLPGMPTLLYHYQANGGKGSALNTGLRLAHGQIIISIDADCSVHPRAIEAFVRCFRDPEVMAAVGNVKIGNTRSLIGTIQYLEYLFSFYFKKTDSVMNTIYIIGGAAGAFRREVFERVGPYSTCNITEDIELSVRIQRAGMRIVYAPDAIIYTEGATDLKGLLKQRLRWKRGRFETFREHRQLFFSRRPEHNKLLTWIILPMAVFGDLQLSFEPSFILILYIFSILTQDFSAFVSGVMVVSLIFFIQLFDDHDHRSFSFLLLAPIGWLLFYLTTFVEFYALGKSLWGLLTHQDLKWQSWQRHGLLNEAHLKHDLHKGH